jgi:Xaa-Pro aminopeptidase
MKNETQIRFNKTISVEELKRRWVIVRDAMKREKLDFILAQNSTEYFGGYVRWLTGLAALTNHPVTVIFPYDDEMTIIWSGPGVPDNLSLPGVKKKIDVTVVPSLAYGNVIEAEKAVGELGKYANCHVGLVNQGTMSAPFYNYVTGHLNGVKFTDVTDNLDEIKAVKSNEEIQCIRETCQMQDKLFQYALSYIQPGRSERQVDGALKGKWLEMGGEQVIVHSGSAPAGIPARPLRADFGTRLIEEGDTCALVIESSCPSGYWGEMVRIVSIGKVSPELAEQFELVKQAHEMTVALLNEDVAPTSIWKAYNDLRIKAGYTEAVRFYAHGQGYDLIERPTIGPDETMMIKKRANFAIHPSVLSEDAFTGLGDNYLLDESGKTERLHSTPQKLFVI